MRRKHLVAEQGSVLLWVVGCIMLVLFAISTAVDVVGLVRATRDLQAVADSAALAATNRLDITSLMQTGSPFFITVDKAEALKAAQSEISRLQPTPKLQSFSVSGRQVSLVLKRLWQAPTLGFSTEISVTATANAYLNELAGL